MSLVRSFTSFSLWFRSPNKLDLDLRVLLLPLLALTVVARAEPSGGPLVLRTDESLPWYVGSRIWCVSGLP
jgi:hypothetical protein